VSQEEFATCMVDGCSREWASRCEQAGIDSSEEKLTWSWDNPRCHGKVSDAVYAKRGISAKNHMGVPPYSPDMHCAIEEAHAVVCRAFNTWLWRNPLPRDEPLQTYWSRLERLFYEKITPQWTQAALKRMLSKVLPAIIRNKGNWPSRECR
jgi:hypothetical protein